MWNKPRWFFSYKVPDNHVCQVQEQKIPQSDRSEPVYRRWTMHSSNTTFNIWPENKNKIILISTLKKLSKFSEWCQLSHSQPYKGTHFQKNEQEKLVSLDPSFTNLSILGTTHPIVLKREIRLDVLKRKILDCYLSDFLWTELFFKNIKKNIAQKDEAHKIFWINKMLREHQLQLQQNKLLESQHATDAIVAKILFIHRHEDSDIYLLKTNYICTITNYFSK